MPNLVNGTTGERLYGGDYYQNINALVVACGRCKGQTERHLQPGGLWKRVIVAGKAQ